MTNHESKLWDDFNAALKAWNEELIKSMLPEQLLEWIEATGFELKLAQGDAE